MGWNSTSCFGSRAITLSPLVYRVARRREARSPAIFANRDFTRVAPDLEQRRPEIMCEARVHPQRESGFSIAPIPYQRPDAYPDHGGAGDRTRRGRPRLEQRREIDAADLAQQRVEMCTAHADDQIRSRYRIDSRRTRGGSELCACRGDSLRPALHGLDQELRGGQAC